MQCVLQHSGENSAYGLGLCLTASTAWSAAGGHQLRDPLKADFADTSFQGEMVLAASGLFLGDLKSGSVQAALGAVAEIWGEYSLAFMAPWHLELAVFYCVVLLWSTGVPVCLFFKRGSSALVHPMSTGVDGKEAATAQLWNSQ